MIADSMMDLLLKSFKVKHRALERDRALQASETFSQWFAVELVYQNKPIRLIVAAAGLPDDLKLPTSGSALPAGPAGAQP